MSTSDGTRHTGNAHHGRQDARADVGLFLRSVFI